MSRLAAAGLAAAIVAFAWGAAGTPKPAGAIGLCGCCAESPAEDCKSACAAMPPVPGQCPAVAVYDGKEQSGTGGNPLNGMSLKDLSLGDPSAAQIESFRRFMEKHRRAAVKAYKAADRLYRHGRITAAEMDAAQTLYDEALVNYQHGIRAYLNKIGRKSD